MTDIQLKQLKDNLWHSAELDRDLLDSYDRVSFNSKTNLLLNHFMDMSVQGYGWVA
jgi:type I restriction enzyme R subunit